MSFEHCIQARPATLILIIPWDLDGSCVLRPTWVASCPMLSKLPILRWHREIEGT